jgi:hypothetical protein
VGAAIAIGAVVGLALGIVVSVTTSVPLAPEPLSEADQRDFGWLAGGYGSDVLDVDLAGDHLVPEVRD